MSVATYGSRACVESVVGRAVPVHTRTIAVLDQRGIAERFLSQGQVARIAGCASIPLDISNFPTRHNDGPAL